MNWDEDKKEKEGVSLFTWTYQPTSDPGQPQQALARNAHGPAAWSPARMATQDSRTGGSPRGLQADARSGTEEGLAPRSGDPASQSIGQKRQYKKVPTP